MKQTLIFLLVLSLLVGLIPISATALSEKSSEIPTIAETWEVDGTAYQVIRTPEDFSSLAVAGNYILANDLNFNGKSASSLVKFGEGTTVLEGNGHCIYGYSLMGESGVSTFSVTEGANITIRNLTLGKEKTPIPLSCTETGKSVGSLFGQVNCTFLINNVTAYVNVKTTNCYVGGLLGYAQGAGTIIDCRCYGSIDNGNGKGARGGIIGQVGSNLETVVIDCVNYADLNYGGYNVGGIVGRIVSGQSVLLSGCTNYGEIKSSNYAGGIVGQIQPKNVSVDYTIQKCYNYGNVTGGIYSGGLLGDIGYDTSVTVTDGGGLTVRESSNYAAISGDSNMGGIAGFIRASYPVSFQNCANYGSVFATENAAGLSSSVALNGFLLTVNSFLNVGSVHATAGYASGVTGLLSDASDYIFEDCINLGGLTGSVVGNLFSMTTGKETVMNCSAFNTDLTATSGECGYVVGAPGKTTGAYTEVRYLSVSDSGWNQSLCNKAMTISEALDWLNANRLDKWGGFMLNADGDSILPAAPKLAGLQEGTVRNDKQAVRFIGVLQNKQQYSEVGFELTVKGVSLGTQSCSTVYLKINAMEDGILKEVSASEVGGEYLYALVVQNIPAEEVVFIEITPYARSANGNMTYKGITYSIAFQNGSYRKSNRVTNEEKAMNISVGTYNILHGLNYPKKLEGTEEIDLSLASDAIRNMKLDICGLNEVRNQENVEGLCNQAKVIAENLGYNYVFAKAIDYRGGEYGNALVTKYPILSSKTIPIIVPNDERIEGQSYENRVLLSADLLIEGRVVTVLVSHFGLSADEMTLAIGVVRDTVKQCINPVILMGDFNFTPKTTYYSELCDFLKDTVDLVEGSTYTFPSTTPTKKIDYLFLNDRCKATSAAIPTVLSSDHRPYIVTLNIS